MNSTLKSSGKNWYKEIWSLDIKNQSWGKRHHGFLIWCQCFCSGNRYESFMEIDKTKRESYDKDKSVIF